MDFFFSWLTAITGVWNFERSPSLFLKDSDADSENISLIMSFCIRWPENMQFKGVYNCWV